jgi:hypothetical protein
MVAAAGAAVADITLVPQPVQMAFLPVARAAVVPVVVPAMATMLILQVVPALRPVVMVVIQLQLHLIYRVPAVAALVE